MLPELLSCELSARLSSLHGLQHELWESSIVSFSGTLKKSAWRTIWHFGSAISLDISGSTFDRSKLTLKVRLSTLEPTGCIRELIPDCMTPTRTNQPD